jgi:hypothetical protein
MFTRRLTTILLAMTMAEALETTRIHRVVGLTGARTAVVTTRPCRAPQHTISDIGLIGGGQVPMPGEGSLANQEMLYLMSCQSPDGTSWRCRANRSLESGLTRGKGHALEAEAYSDTAHKPERADYGPSDERRDHNEHQQGGQRFAGHRRPWEHKKGGEHHRDKGMTLEIVSYEALTLPDRTAWDARSWAAWRTAAVIHESSAWKTVE